MSKDLDELRERRNELILESEINRQILQLEFGQLSLKAVEWRRGLFKVNTLYKWLAPLAGVGLGFLGARKQMRHSQGRAHRGTRHNGHGKFNYLGLLAPFGSAALKQAFAFWRHSRRRSETQP